MVEVYKTNVKKRKQAKLAVKKLKEKFPLFNINFDFEDCDRVLRMENPDGKIDNKLVIELIGNLGFFIEVLPDTLPVKNIKMLPSETDPISGINNQQCNKLNLQRLHSWFLNK